MAENYNSRWTGEQIDEAVALAQQGSIITGAEATTLAAGSAATAAVEGNVLKIGVPVGADGAAGPAYTLTDTDKNTIATAVKDSITPEGIGAVPKYEDDLAQYAADRNVGGTLFLKFPSATDLYRNEITSQGIVLSHDNESTTEEIGIGHSAIEFTVENGASSGFGFIEMTQSNGFVFGVGNSNYNLDGSNIHISLYDESAGISKHYTFYHTGNLQTETWTFTLEDGSTVTKAVYVG